MLENYPVIDYHKCFRGQKKTKPKRKQTKELTPKNPLKRTPKKPTKPQPFH